MKDAKYSVSKVRIGLQQRTMSTVQILGNPIIWFNCYSLYLGVDGWIILVDGLVGGSPGGRMWVYGLDWTGPG